MSNFIRHYSMGKIRKELAEYILNCSDDELYDLCSIIPEKIESITMWSCEECQKNFNPNCKSKFESPVCKKYFSEINKPFYK